MAVDRAFLERNRASIQRMLDVAAALSDEGLRTRVGEHWTVGIVYAHIAFWERRVMYVLDQTQKEGKLFIPTIDIFVNDLSLPLWAAIPPREAVRIAIEEAQAVDLRLENYPSVLLDEIFEYNKRWVERSLHRDQHLNEAVEAIHQVGLS
jgi:hypothetical protein